MAVDMRIYGRTACSS